MLRSPRSLPAALPPLLLWLLLASPCPPAAAAAGQAARDKAELCAWVATWGRPQAYGSLAACIADPSGKVDDLPWVTATANGATVAVAIALDADAGVALVPASLASLQGLRHFTLANNALARGTNLSSVVAAMPPLLATLNLTNDGIAGPVPPVLRTLAQLKTLVLDGNPLTGDAPAFTGSCSMRGTCASPSAASSAVLVVVGNCPAAATAAFPIGRQLIVVLAVFVIATVALELCGIAEGGRNSTGQSRRAVAAGVAAGVAGTAVVAGVLVAGLVALRMRRRRGEGGQAQGAQKMQTPLMLSVNVDSCVASDPMPPGDSSVPPALKMALTSSITLPPPIPPDFVDSRHAETSASDVWDVEPRIATFSLNGQQAGVGAAITDRLTVANRSAHSLRYYLCLPTSNKYTVQAAPGEGTIPRGGNAVVEVSVTMHCTASIDDPLLLVVNYEASEGNTIKEHKKVGLAVRGKLSTRIDYDELVFGDVVGEGNFGTVYRGTWRGSEVAIKQIRGGSYLSLEELGREIDILEQIRSPFVVTFYGAAVVPRRVSLVTEFAPHGSLAGVMQRQTLSQLYRLRVASNVASGMKFLHACGIVHRDLKPDNVLIMTLSLDCPVVAKITDFGTSRTICGGCAAELLRMTSGVGTPAYMAPEAMIDGGSASTPADVYSYAVLLWELWTGRKAFGGDEATSIYILSRHVVEGGRPEIPADCPAGLRELLASAWHGDPARRPAFAEVEQSIERVALDVALGTRAGGAVAPDEAEGSAAGPSACTTPQCSAQIEAL
eukprot:m51a1_g5366 putative protein serine threonine (780) ;mRNA; r:516582-519978